MDVANIGGAMGYCFAEVRIEVEREEENEMVAAMASAQSSTSVSVRMNARCVHGRTTPRLQDEQWQHAANEGHGRNWRVHPKEEAHHRLKDNPVPPDPH